MMTEVTFADTNYSRIDRAMLRRLKEQAMASTRGRARFCLHPTHDETIQQMIIAFRDDVYIPPHRQTGPAKSYIALDGKFAVGFFDERGRLTERVLMGPAGSGTHPVLRFVPLGWHMTAAITRTAIYMELYSGPYAPTQTEYADWAPPETDSVVATSFLAALQGD